MFMDIHPLIVHFPIAFLSIYALFELFQTKKMKEAKSWFLTKGVLLFFGTAGAFLSLVTGDVAKELQGGYSKLVGMHELFAQGTTVIFTVLLVHYGIRGITHLFEKRISASQYAAVWERVLTIDEKIYASPVIFLFALLGFFGILIVGALGGAIVYGPDADPFVSFVYRLFFR
jgi:uncharacterized membrane protein